MFNAKLCGLVIACSMGVLGISPTTVFATETNTESTTLAETNKNQKENKAAFDEIIEKASQKWDSLTEKQKAEVYSLIEDQMESEIKVINKLVKLGVMQKEDAETFKAHMMERFEKTKESGDFPFSKPKRNKNSN